MVNQRVDTAVSDLNGWRRYMNERKTNGERGIKSKIKRSRLLGMLDAVLKVAGVDHFCV